MTDEKNYSKNNLDEYLKELGKAFRKLNGKTMEAEIILIGGAAIVSNYNFRKSTTDIDAYIRASSAMKDAINIVGDSNGLKTGWLNDDFKKTASFSPKIPQYSIPYRTFSNILQVRTMPGEYIVAMKLASFRPYKYDQSDIIGIISEKNIKKEDVITAVNNLYGNIDSLQHNNEIKLFLDEIYNSNDLQALYEKTRNREKRNLFFLKNAQDYGVKLSEDNIDSVIKNVESYVNKKASKSLNTSSDSKKYQLEDNKKYQKYANTLTQIYEKAEKVSALPANDASLDDVFLGLKERRPKLDSLKAEINQVIQDMKNNDIDPAQIYPLLPEKLIQPVSKDFQSSIGGKSEKTR